MTTFVFPGQGSQTKGMGATLFQQFPDLVAQADQILGYSIKELCLEDPDNLLHRTDYTQPALYVVNVLSFLEKIHQGAKLPEYAAGHSLGEYNALFAAEVFDFASGLELVKKRGELMSQIVGGTMAAIIGLTAEVVQKIIDDNGLKMLSIANFNSLQQIVIAGPKNTVQQAQDIFITAGAKLFIPLKVSGAFHSSYMEPASQAFATFIKSYPFSAPKIKVIANINTLPYAEKQIADNLIQQITGSVRWTQTIEYLIMQGETDFKEIGPGRVLTGLIGRIQNGQ